MENYLKKQEKFFDAHKEVFLREHHGKIAMIPDTLDVEFFDDYATAAKVGWAKYGEGHIMLQECTEEALEPIEIMRAWPCVS